MGGGGGSEGLATKKRNRNFSKQKNLPKNVANKFEGGGGEALMAGRLKNYLFSGFPRVCLTIYDSKKMYPSAKWLSLRGTRL